MTRMPFGATRIGQPVERLTLDNGEIRACILTVGATLQDVRLDGHERPLTLGSEAVSDYEADGPLHYFGPVVGPVANRIRNATTQFDGRALHFEPNGAGGHVLHAGSAGLHHKVWEVEAASGTRVVLSTAAPDGEGGFPGNRRWEAEFVLEGGAALTLKLRAETDAPTLMNLANHSYWNLSDNATFHGHLLQIDADTYLPTDENGMATGERRAVEATPMDFRLPRALAASDALDHNFCLSEARGLLRRVAALTAPDSLTMEVATTEPGLQIYDARHMPAEGATGLKGRLYGPRCGVAIEAQFWPDAPNRPGFPSIRMEPGDRWEQVTRFSFSKP